MSDNSFFEILKYTIPAAIVFLTSFFLLKMFLKNEEQKRRHELAIENKKITSPVRLQAYERLVLLLERISLDSMIKRMHKQEMTVSQFQTKLLITIRTEFEHNFSQQIYVSHQAWQMVTKAKENSIKHINSTALNLNPKHPAIVLSKELLESAMQMESTPTATAINYLKKEVQDLL